jgi:two-component system phosphate regulon sensor histidine kinase PhoR
MKISKIKKNYKIKLLVLFCVIIVSVLILIQYYLVRNTYNLTKDKYYGEVTRGINRIINQSLHSDIEAKTQENLRSLARLYVAGQLSREEFLRALRQKNDPVINKQGYELQQQIESQPNLKNIRFKSQYDEIKITYGNHSEKILTGSDPPFVFTGPSFNTANTLIISSGSNTLSDEVKIPHNGQNVQLKLEINRSQYIDISSWKQEVWKRMAWVFIMAVLLILAVIILYYIAFNTMIRQKKLADIKTDFANNITHELKTPLSSVNLILKTLEREEVRVNKIRMDELIYFLKRQFNKIQGIVDSVLESAMVTQLEIRKENIDITEYLNKYVKDVWIETHHFVSHIDTAALVINTNTEVVDKILGNLIENAAKYSPAGSQITLTGYSRGKYYLVEITDQGPGIADEDHPFIFDKFFRVTEHNRHNVKGLGLGLYLSKQAATSIGSNLYLKSKTGHGSVFTLELPL